MVRLITLVIATIASQLLVGCKSETTVKTFERPVKLYTTESLEYFTTSYVGTVKSDEVSNIAFKMGGQLTKLSVVEGQKVTKGQFIAEIDPIDFNLQLASAKAAYVNSKAQLERYESLIAKDAISRQQFDAVQANYVRDKSNYESAQSMLSETKIYAPFSGIIEKKYVENYQRVQPVEPIVRLINPKNLEVIFTLPESNVQYMSAPSKQFYVEFETYPNIKFKAKVTKYVDSSVDGSGVPVTVAIDDPSFDLQKYTVKPGFSCTIFLQIDNTTEAGVTYIPLSALYNSPETKKDGVWVYNTATSTVELKDVTVGELFGTNNITIKSGIKPGEKIVSAGIYQLTNNQKVKVLK
ncbi:MAG: efflux RND transporter periplasmic adaptor subunit [Rikenellaceae bacterium]